MRSLELDVGGMGCGGCVEKVSGALRSVPGVQVRQVGVGSATVSFDPAKASAKHLVDAVTRAGFTAREVGDGGGHGGCCTN